MNCQGCGAENEVGVVICAWCASSMQAADEPAAAGPAELACPRCHAALTCGGVLGEAAAQCSSCQGLWLGAGGLDRLLSSPEQLAALPHEAPERRAETGYLPCAECGTMMNRRNHSRRSGVLIDECRGHGTWLDAGELAALARFAASGGMKEAEEAHADQESREQHQREKDERAKAIREAANRPVRGGRLGKLGF
jgi:Zn-finger nucleic acid-binding protein